jgi:hypothetical protein
MSITQEQEKRALELRNRAVKLANERGACRRKTQGDASLLSYQDEWLSIAYKPAKGEHLHGIDVWQHNGGAYANVLSVAWSNGGREVVVVYLGGLWEQHLERLHLNSAHPA